MSTTGSKFLLALAAFGLLGAALYGLGTGGDPIGVISVGYKGGVGEHSGYAVLLSLAVVAGALGGLMAAFRDADPVSLAEVSSEGTLPTAPAPRTPSYWPLVGAFGAVITALGLVVGTGLFILGVVVLVVALFEWTVRAWADRATGDDDANREVRDRFMRPVEIPVIAVGVIGGLVLGASRVFLALPKLGATFGAIIVATLIFVVATVVALRPKVSRSVVGAVLLAGGLAVVVGGIVGAAVGERDIEPHGGETEEHGGTVGEEAG